MLTAADNLGCKGDFSTTEVVGAGIDVVEAVEDVMVGAGEVSLIGGGEFTNTLGEAVM